MRPFTFEEKWYDTIDDILDEIDFVKGNTKIAYGNVASVFDIEASSFYNANKEKQATMYCWIFGINGRSIRGRTWDEFIKVINRIVEYYELDLKTKRFIIYIHNLSYEFQYIKDLFRWNKVFAVKDRTPVYAITNEGIEFRCSYLLSGYSLAKVGENLTKYPVKKMVGDLDYSLIRHSATPLTDKEWGYVLHDGLVMCYIQEEIERNGDITRLPLTNTGFVRRYCRNRLKYGADKYTFYHLRDATTLTVETYEQLKRTYSGGFTHANSRNVGKLFKDVSSCDFTSSYPAVMLSEMFPCSEAKEVEIHSKEEFFNYLHGRCCMFTAKFINIESTFKYEHYISLYKCRSHTNAVTDNGRVDEADELVIDLTEQDFFIIQKVYKWDSIEIYNFKIFNRNYLPKDLILAILELYKKKTTLKGVVGYEAEYQHSKGELNSVYGMSVTDPCKNAINYSNESGWEQEENDIADLIDKYNNSKGRFLFYAVGIWVTAYARMNLWSGIIECKEDYIYSDTDSIKCINYEKHAQYFDRYNKNIKEKVKACLRYHDISVSNASPKTKEGKSKPIGVWDYENEGNLYTRFKTLGSKRYIYTEINKKTNGEELHITIAGVSKTLGQQYLMYKFKTFDNVFKHFNDRLLFPKLYYNKDVKVEGKEEKGKWLSGSGKNTHTYIDLEQEGDVTDYLGVTNHYHELSSVHIEGADYDMRIEEQFLHYLEGLDEWEEL